MLLTNCFLYSFVLLLTKTFKYYENLKFIVLIGLFTSFVLSCAKEEVNTPQNTFNDESEVLVQRIWVVNLDHGEHSIIYLVLLLLPACV